MISKFNFQNMRAPNFSSLNSLSNSRQETPARPTERAPERAFFDGNEFIPSVGNPVTNDLNRLRNINRGIPRNRPPVVSSEDAPRFENGRVSAPLGPGSTFNTSSVISFDSPSLGFIGGREDNYRVNAYGGDDKVQVNLGRQDDKALVSLGSGNDSTEIFGGSGSDAVTTYGGDGEDNIKIDGGTGDDKLFAAGDRGNDRVLVDGGSGNDRITIRGGSGDDQVQANGGAGDDNFIYTLAAGQDEVSLSGGEGQDSAKFYLNDISNYTILSENGEILEQAGSGGTTIRLSGVENYTLAQGKAPLFPGV